MKKEGSTAGFVLSLIGGILGLIVGFQLLLTLIVNLWGASIIGGNIAPGLIALGIFLSFYLFILNTWILFSAVWMRKDIQLRKGAKTSLICGILSLNLLAIIGGAIGFSKSKKNS